MGLTNYPQGLSSFGVPVMGGGGNVPVTSGTYFFVDSVTGSDSYNGLSKDKPFATLSAALSACTASKNDVVLVMPSHAETISTAGGITMSKIGVAVVGLGQGALRPTFSLSATAATWAISAASCSVSNIRIATTIDAVVKVFNITAAGVTLDTVDFVETASCAALQFVLTTAAADDLTIQNCSWVQSQTAATATMAWISLVGADRAKIKNNYANLKGYATANPANGVIVGATTASLDVEIVGNRFIILNSTGNVPISLLANSTGFVGYNSVHSSKTALAGQIALASAYGSENYASNTVNTAGILDPVADT